MDGTPDRGADTARPPKAGPLTARQIRNLLARRYNEDHWHLAFEVRDRTGYQIARNSFADALAMHRWPSRGHVIHGHEIKVSRADWLNEISNPAKADRFMAHVDHWWLVAPAKIVNESEIPESWGFLRASANSLRVVKDAPKLTDGPTAGVPMDRGFVASLMRRTSEQDPAWAEALERAEEVIERRVTARRNTELETLRRRLADWDRFDDEFAGVFGERFRPGWHSPALLARRIQAAMALVATLDNEKLDSIERSVRTVDKALATLRSQVLGQKETGPDSPPGAD